MSVPTPPPERQSAYPHQTPPPAAPVPPPADPTVVYPAALQPAAVPVEPVPVAAAVPARPVGPSVDAGRYWAGVVATALVAALVGLVGVVIVDQIIKIELVVKDLFGTDSVSAAYVVGGVLAAVVAGALLQLLVLTTPRPRAFFGWIMFLALVVAALIPLTWTDSTKSALTSGALNLVVGIAIWTLLSSVLTRTLRPGVVVE